MNATNNPYAVTPPTDKTLTQEGVPADAKTVGDALSVVKGMLKVAKVKLSDISVDVENTSYYYTKKISFADKIPTNAIVLAATASDWGGLSCGTISVYTDTTDKSIQISANKRGAVGTLYIDVLYIEEV